MTIYAFHNFREILRNELATRKKRNRSYSMRAFARDIGISPSRLSEVLQEHSILSANSAQMIATALGYSQREREYFCDLVDSECAAKPEQRIQARERLKDIRLDAEQFKLSLEQFHLISGWYHMALVEILQIENFEHSEVNIARALGITTQESAAALTRLETLGFIKKTTTGFEVLRNRTSVMSETPSRAIKEHHTHILEKAANALYFQSMQERDFSSMIFSMPAHRMQEAKEMLRDFRRAFVRRMGDDAKADNVYCLGVQLFRLSQISPTHTNDQDLQVPRSKSNESPAAPN